ncbi:Uncharacterized protein QTN25_006522 [Entamoeba marina]
MQRKPFTEWKSLFMWISLVFFEIFSVLLALAAFFSLAKGVGHFKETNDQNFEIPNAYSIPTNQLSPARLGDDVISPFADYLEANFMNYLYSKGIFKYSCLPNATFSHAQINQCLWKYCQKNSNNDECIEFLSSNGESSPSIILKGVDCDLSFSFTNSYGQTTKCNIHVKAKELSMMYTSSISEVKRLLVVYNVPILLTFDVFTIRPLIEDSTLAGEIGESVREYPITNSGRYLASPTLQSNGKLRNVNIVGWSSDYPGFIIKDTYGTQFGQSKDFFEGERSASDDNEICQNNGFRYWLPIGNGNETTELNLDLSVCNKYYQGSCPFEEDTIYYLNANSYGLPATTRVNEVFEMYDTEIIDADSNVHLLSNFTVCMIESLFKPIRSDENSNADCGYSIISYTVLRRFFELHNITGKNVVGFTRIDFDFDYSSDVEDELWGIC